MRLHRALSAEPKSPRRSRLEIMHSILSLCQQGKAGKTHIMYHSDLSWRQLQKYLETLTAMGLLEVNPHSYAGLYAVTEKGKRFLEEFQNLKKLLEE